MKVFFFKSDRYAAGYYRCEVPAKALRKLGVEAVADLKVDFKELREFDAIVFQRKAHYLDLELLKKAKSLGILTIYDLEDNLFKIPPENPSKSFWNRQRLQIALNLIRQADLVTVTTSKIEEYVRAFNKNTKIIPNYLDIEKFEFKTKTKIGEIVIGWSGSPSHLKDVQPVIPILLDLKDRYSDRLKIKFQGLPRRLINLPPPIEQNEAWLPYDEYLKEMSTYDIGIAPLESNQFNEAKSDLKFIEYGAFGIPCVCSKVGEYKLRVKNGLNGFLAENAKDWLKYLKMLIEDVKIRDFVRVNARKMAQERDLDQAGKAWLKVLEGAYANLRN